MGLLYFLLVVPIPVVLRLILLCQMTMRGSLAKARVLYAPVEEVGGEDRLMRACRIHVYLSSVLCAYYNLSLHLNEIEF